MDWLSDLLDLARRSSNASFLRDAFATLALVVMVLLARSFAIRAVARTDVPPEQRRRWLGQIRSVVIIVFLFGIVVIWASELRTVALSLVAFAAAVVLAIKELLLCLSGSFLRGVSRSFKLGDRIEVGAVRGDVIDIGVLTTTIQEIGPGATIHQHTGRAVVLPNSVWLSSPVTNVSHLDEYGFHVLTVPVEDGADVQAVEEALLEAARAECAEFLDAVRRYLDRMERHRGIDTPSPDPRVWLRIASTTQIELLLRFPAPIRRVGLVEQGILRRFLAAAAPRRARPA